jgi:hypothetical protein
MARVQMVGPVEKAARVEIEATAVVPRGPEKRQGAAALAQRPDGRSAFTPPF